MVLEEELGFQKPIEVPAHKALLGIYYTASCLRKHGTKFFRKHGITEVQFNLIMLLQHQAGKARALSQTQLSRMLLVNGANISSLVDRMELAGLVTRVADPDDRRYNMVQMTSRGRECVLRIEKAYIGEVRKIMGALSTPEQKKLSALLDRTRENLRAVQKL